MDEKFSCLATWLEPESKGQPCRVKFSTLMGESGSERGAEQGRQITLDRRIRCEVNSEHRK